MFPRRSKRAGVQKAKARAKQDIETLESWSRTGHKKKVLALALPPQEEDYEVLRNQATGRADLGLVKAQRQTSMNKPVGSMARHILFLNLGDATILAAARGEYPPWTRNVRGLVTKKGKLYLDEDGVQKRFALAQEKRDLVKSLYFNPKKPSTIQPITDELREKYCNISRRNVSNILRSLETYQLMFPRRLPPKISNKTLYTKPGVIAADTFFPSETTGWKKRNILCIMDVWSRFSRAYAIASKDAKLFKKAMVRFLQEFTSLGHLPRRLLTDKGTELAGGTEVMEKYRLKKDGDDPLHLKSFTGMPVQVVENMNAQYQRRLEAYRIAALHDDPKKLLHDISEQLNNQRRPKRGNFTPYELLSLNQKQRNSINRKYENTTDIGITGQRKLPLLSVGDHVRKLMMTFKEQMGGAKKGFQEKWSRRVYQVLRISALRRNKFAKKYQIGDPKRTYYRHELLLIPKKVDQTVMRFPSTDSKVIGDHGWKP